MPVLDFVKSKFLFAAYRATITTKQNQCLWCWIRIESTVPNTGFDDQKLHDDWTNNFTNAITWECQSAKQIGASVMQWWRHLQHRVLLKSTKQTTWGKLCKTFEWWLEWMAQLTLGKNWSGLAWDCLSCFKLCKLYTSCMIFFTEILLLSWDCWSSIFKLFYLHFAEFSAALLYRIAKIYLLLRNKQQWIKILRIGDSVMILYDTVVSLFMFKGLWFFGAWK